PGVRSQAGERVVVDPSERAARRALAQDPQGQGLEVVDAAAQGRQLDSDWTGPQQPRMKPATGDGAVELEPGAEHQPSGSDDLEQHRLLTQGHALERGHVGELAERPEPTAELLERTLGVAEVMKD